MGALVEDQHVGAVLREHGGGDQPGGSGTDHDDVVGVVHQGLLSLDVMSFERQHVVGTTSCQVNMVEWLRAQEVRAGAPRRERRADPASDPRRGRAAAAGGADRAASLDAIARDARVSRSTIYGVFGSRSGLLDAFVTDLWERTGLPALTDAVASDDARTHLREGLAAASRMKAGDLEVYRALHAMDRLDPESSGNAVRQMEIDRRGGMEHLARRLHEAGALRDDVTVEWATHLLWVLTSSRASTCWCRDGDCRWTTPWRCW